MAGAANPWAGEVTLVLNGQSQRMKLTLGALAQLESALGTGSLMELVSRFESGAFSAGDLQALLLAGLMGGGWRGNAADLAAADIAGGPMEATRAAARLLALSFTSPEGGAP
ncbi:gene transfer agent family protein [Cognatishimia sp. SS12]|uniref:gene transfer agent family protein n=1 Tax=Cognatishimia sp. SS12 TaxID=2979465 RepID=UPI00232F5420|nr:gene transfer agent family protein [Cognatishimia sp. SS12]MDC0737529.1 gene transfer agent family protein [Cognatishimia sp. SS12]